MRRLVVAVLVLSWGSIGHAGWFHDFNDEVVPEGFTTIAYDQSGAEPMDVSLSAENGVLRMWDPRGVGPENGGVKGVFWVGPEVFEGNVRVSAEINSDGTSDDHLGLVLLSDRPNGVYLASLRLNESAWGDGHLMLGKAYDRGAQSDWGTSAFQWVTEYDRPYFMEMELARNHVTGFPKITVRLYESEGGALINEIFYVDTNRAGVPPYTELRAGVYAEVYTGDPNGLNAVFDNIRAVPEPSTLVLLTIGAVGLLVWRRKKGQLSRF